MKTIKKVLLSLETALKPGGQSSPLWVICIPINECGETWHHYPAIRTIGHHLAALGVRHRDLLLLALLLGHLLTTLLGGLLGHLQHNRVSYQQSKYTIWSLVCEASCHLVIWSFSHLVIQSSGHPVNRSSHHHVIST